MSLDYEHEKGPKNVWLFSIGKVQKKTYKVFEEGGYFQISNPVC